MRAQPNWQPPINLRRHRRRLAAGHKVPVIEYNIQTTPPTPPASSCWAGVQPAHRQGSPIMFSVTDRRRSLQLFTPSAVFAQI
jgi:hypothetical protein